MKVFPGLGILPYFKLLYDVTVDMVADEGKWLKVSAGKIIAAVAPAGGAAAWEEQIVGVGGATDVVFDPVSGDTFEYLIHAPAGDDFSRIGAFVNANAANYVGYLYGVAYTLLAIGTNNARAHSMMSGKIYTSSGKVYSKGTYSGFSDDGTGGSEGAAGVSTVDIASITKITFRCFGGNALFPEGTVIRLRAI